MKTYRIKLHPHGAWGSPWRADSLFGGLAWQCARAFPEGRLEEWISRLDSDPVFVLSDAFPGDWFPAPIGPAYRAAGDGKARAPHWVREEDFRKMLADPEFRSPPSLTGDDGLFRDAHRLQASLGRSTNLSDPAAGGALFEVALQVLAKAAGGYFSVYVRTSEIDEVARAFELLSVIGFGRKFSTGLGAFTMEPPQPCDWLDDFSGTSGFVALGHFVPAAIDPMEGAWRAHVTYPKYLGNAVEHPFKGRLVQLAAGSCFYTGGEPKAWYGRAVRLSFEGRVQYGLCLAAPAAVRRNPH